MRTMLTVIKSVLSDLPHAVIAVLTTILVLMIYYATLISSTPWEIFVESNVPGYVWAQIILSSINAVLIGLVIAMLFYVLALRIKGSNLTFLQAAASLLFSMAATGCTVCGAVLLPTLGIAASLTALPLAGLEIKILTILLLLYSLYEYSKIIAGKCDITFDKVMTLTKNGNGYTMDFNRSVFWYLKPVVVIVLFYGVLLVLPRIPKELRINFNSGAEVQASEVPSKDDLATTDFSDQINPAEGYDLGINYGDIGPKLLEAGVIDLDKFVQTYQNAGQPLTDEQMQILTSGSTDNIRIDKDNAYFLLNFFWAFGLANQNTLLTDGPIAQYGDGEVGNFASTGGWSLASSTLEEYYSKNQLVTLSEEQQQLVEAVSGNIYRPCCGNPTSFPDCNHGMALLGILEVMAANGATEKQMYDAAKYINSFWFPSTYNDLAMYFKATQGQSFADIDSETILAKDYSSGSGYMSKKKWLQQEGILPEPPQNSGGGCGV